MYISVENRCCEKLEYLCERLLFCCIIITILYLTCYSLYYNSCTIIINERKIVFALTTSLSLSAPETLALLPVDPHLREGPG